MLSPHANKHSPYSDIVPLESRQDFHKVVMSQDAELMQKHADVPLQARESGRGFLINWLKVQTWKWVWCVTS